MGKFKTHAASAGEGATVAYIEERPTGWLVVWRDAKTGKKASSLVKWGGDPHTLGGVVTKEDARRAAEDLRGRKAQTERAARRPLPGSTGRARTGRTAVEDWVSVRLYGT